MHVYSRGKNITPTHKHSGTGAGLGSFHIILIISIVPHYSFGGWVAAKAATPLGRHSDPRLRVLVRDFPPKHAPRVRVT